MEGDMRAAIVCIIVSFALLPIVATAQPTITIYTDADAYQSGDTIEVSLSAENLGEEMAVGVYVGLLTPDGGISAVQWDGWSGSLEPWIPDIHVPARFSMDSTPFWWFDLPSSMPPIEEPGDYNFAVVLTLPGALHWVSELSLAPFTVDASPGSHCYINEQMGSDGNNGSEGSPWKTITHAINSVDASESDPVTIHVAAGTYSASTNGEAFPLNMKSYVSLSGEDRDSTILNAENEAYHVICCENVMQLTIEGLTIAGGRADTKWPPDADCLGGGIYCSNCQGGDSLAIQNNRISGNSADSGGGISCLEGSSPTIEDNIIIGNSADFSGGAINCYDSPMILDNLISGNSAGAGGGIYCNGSATIQNNSISENTTTGHGGGIYCDWSDKSTIIDNMITSNSGRRHARHRDGRYGLPLSDSVIFRQNRIRRT